MRIDKIRDTIFATAFGFLTTHELDAVRHVEWRILPPLRWMPDEIGMTVFIVAHVPLFVWLVSACWGQNLQSRQKVRSLFAGFCCVHVGLHWLLRNDPSYLFQGWLSNGLIGGAGFAGALFLFMTYRGKHLR